MTGGVGPLPAWSLAGEDAAGITSDWPGVTRAWAWEGASGAGARVCVVDSGVDAEHPDVGGDVESLLISVDEDERLAVEPDDAGDVAGHGTACAGIIRSLAPDCAITSLRVLGSRGTGSGPELLAGLRWAVAQGFDVVNLSLSSSRRGAAMTLYELADDAYFRRTLLVAAAHNRPVESFPWRFSSVISVGSHDGVDPLRIYANPSPPVEFFARGMKVKVAWSGGGRTEMSGNSFAAATVSGLCALIRSKHPELTPYQVKAVLYEVADNVGAA